MAEVIFSNVCKRYGPALQVVHNLEFSVGDGEFLVLVGPSGCGKSTTLRMLAGLETVSEGDISIDGTAITHMHPRDRDIAMVFQSYALYPHMSVYQNMALNLKVKGVDNEEIKSRIRRASAILGIDALLDRKPSQLSGGQKQRVAVGRAIVREPKVFLFDEPLSNLDAKLRVTMRNEIGALHERLEATMVYVTHDQVEAMTLGTRIAVMRDGFLQQIAPPKEVYNAPRNMFVAGFIGSPPMNFITGRIERDDGLRFVGADGTVSYRISDDDADTLSRRAGEEIVMGVRPEHLQIGGAGQGLCQAEPTRVESLGAETIFYFELNGIPLVCRIPEGDVGSSGSVALTCQPDRVHFFDASTEDRLILH